MHCESTKDSQGVHSHILEYYVRTNIGFTLKLEHTNCKTCTSNIVQVIYQPPWCK